MIESFLLTAVLSQQVLIRSRSYLTKVKLSTTVTQLQALVYDILPSPTAVFSYVIGSCHLPPKSARYSYATEGALFISAQLSTDVVSALRRVWVLINLQALACS